MSVNRKNIRVLVAPLDWGLGHATRCVPVIGELLHQNCEVVLAADGAIAQLLVREFPQLELRFLQGYRIRYGKRNLLLNILMQLPRILRNIRKEQKWLNLLLQKETFDIIISDNRPGFFSTKTYSIYITHQLRIQSGIHFLIDDFLQRIHNHFMKKFDEVWIPDNGTDNNCSGELSHLPRQLIHPTFIGPVSRLKETFEQPICYELMILLSGPEPQRSLLEQMLLFQLKNTNMNVLFVRGLPGKKSVPNADAPITIVNHLTASQLEIAFRQSERILCRSGYTTIMDLLKLNKKALLIPTPGQPEQEYLAANMLKKSYFPSISQKKFDLQTAMQTVEEFRYLHPFSPHDFEKYKTEVTRIITSKRKQ